jgi:acyl carrier protein
MQLPRLDRRAALESLVAGEFKRALLMSEEDELPMDENYFDLGLTSLRASEVKQRLEEELLCELDTALLFGSSTVRQIVGHLATVALPDVVAPSPREPDPARALTPDQCRLVSELIADLYEA